MLSSENKNKKYCTDVFLHQVSGFRPELENGEIKIQDDFLFSCRILILPPDVLLLLNH